MGGGRRPCRPSSDASVPLPLFPFPLGGAAVFSGSFNDNICYLNFNREFLTAIPDEDPYVTIYALVNSLAELDSVQRVQIAVDGSQTVMLRDAVSLDTLFEENPDLIAD